VSYIGRLCMKFQHSNHVLYFLFF